MAQLERNCPSRPLFRMPRPPRTRTPACGVPRASTGGHVAAARGGRARALPRLAATATPALQSAASPRRFSPRGARACGARGIGAGAATPADCHGGAVATLGARAAATRGGGRRGPPDQRSLGRRRRAHARARAASILRVRMRRGHAAAASRPRLSHQRPGRSTADVQSAQQRGGEFGAFGTLWELGFNVSGGRLPGSLAGLHAAPQPPPGRVVPSTLVPRHARG